jgi:hypothetical protein
MVCDIPDGGEDVGGQGANDVEVALVACERDVPPRAGTRGPAPLAKTGAKRAVLWRLVVGIVVVVQLRTQLMPSFVCLKKFYKG